VLLLSTRVGTVGGVADCRDGVKLTSVLNRFTYQMLNRFRFCIPGVKPMGRIQPGTGGPPLASTQREQMNRWKVIVACVGSLLCNRYPLQRAALAIYDRRDTPAGSGGARARTLPGHSAGFPVRLDLILRTGKLEPDGTKLIDFVITNTLEVNRLRVITLNPSS
jgi:hypothetical protein